MREFIRSLAASKESGVSSTGRFSTVGLWNSPSAIFLGRGGQLYMRSSLLLQANRVRAGHAAGGIP